MNKKGFTLVELLAVIAILAILVIIAMPNVMGMFKNAKKSSFVTETQTILKTSNTQYITDAMTGAAEKKYARVSNSAPSGMISLDMSGNTNIDYYIEYNQTGDVVVANFTNHTYTIKCTGAAGAGVTVEDITEASSSKCTIAEIGTDNAKDIDVTTGTDVAE